MRIFVVGATGAIGRRLVPLLVAEGHQVTGTTRGAGGEHAVRALGAEPSIMNALDRDAVLAAITAAEPEVIIHQGTALAAMTGNPRTFDREFAETNALRTRGLDHLLEAAQKAGVRRFIAQSFTGWPNQRTGGPVKTEEDPLDPDPPKQARQTIAAIRYLEETVTAAGGLALRYGAFYGPGTNMSGQGTVAKLIKRRRFPIIGDGSGVWSFIQIEDAATATAKAMNAGVTGLYNIVDDDPAPVSDWLPHLARALGAPPPLRVPVRVGRLAGGDLAVALMTEIRGSSNAKAKRDLAWTPSHPTWREGFAAAEVRRPK